MYMHNVEVHTAYSYWKKSEVLVHTRNLTIVIIEDIDDYRVEDKILFGSYER